jgi:transposase
MDTSTQATELITGKGQSGTRPKRQYRPIEEKRRIVEETLVEGASVARVALSHGVNANQVFGWRKLYLAGRLGSASRAIKLLPVHVSENSPSLAPTTHRECSPSVELAKSTPGTIHVELRHAQVRIEGSADPALLRVLLECLRR